MKYFYKLVLVLFLLIFHINILSANEKTAFIDVDYIIQNSNIGKKALNNIKALDIKNVNKFESKDKSLRELESSIRSKKNIISEVDFNNEVKAFQQKVKDFTTEKDQTVRDFNKFRKQELEKIFKLFNPIITNYMKENSVNILIDSKNVFMGTSDANLTDDILNKINEKLQ